MKTLPDDTAQKDTSSPVLLRHIENLPLLSTRMLASWQHIAFWVIMVLAACLRLYQFPNTPAGLWVDEVTEGYEAYALLQHGTDRWGNPFPIYFPGWGSGQNVLEAYLNIPFIKLFGLNVFAIRLLPNLLGILAVYLLYVTVKKIYGTNTALLAAFLLATLPWSMMASRWSMESNLLPFFFLLSVFTLISCYESPHRRRWIPLSLIPAALSFYAYGTSIIPIAIFIALFLVFNYKTILKAKVSFIISIIVFLLISAPFLLYVLENNVLHRALPFLAHLPITIPYLPLSRLDQVNKGLSHFGILRTNLRFVIGGYHDKWLLNSIPWISPLGWLVPPFAVLGVYFSLKRQLLSRNLFVFWLIGTLPLFVLFVFTVHRSNALYIPLITLSAYGIVSLLESVQPINSRIMVTLLLLGSLFFPNVVFYRYYFTTYNKDNGASFSAGYDQALNRALAVAHNDEYIYVNITKDWSNYAYTIFYLQSDAEDFYTHANIQVVDGIYRVSSYRRYYFGPDAPPRTLTDAPSYVAILKGNYQVSCQRKEILYQDNHWPGGEWTVVRCYPSHNTPLTENGNFSNDQWERERKE